MAELDVRDTAGPRVLLHPADRDTPQLGDSAALRRRRLLPFFGDLALAELEARPELIDDHVVLKAEIGLSAKTIQNHLLLLNVMLRCAVEWRLIRTNPIASVDRPSVAQPEMRVLTEAEIARLTSVYDELIAEASAAEGQWWLLAKGRPDGRRNGTPTR